MAKSKKKSGCFSILIILIIVGAISNLFSDGTNDTALSTNESSSMNLTTESNTEQTISDSENSKLAIQEEYPEFTDEILDLFKIMGLNPEDYIPEKLGVGVTVDFRADTKNFTNNYQKMTVENLNSTFENTDISINEIFSLLGRPDHMTIDRDFRNDGKTTYSIEASWNESETDETQGRIEVAWPISKDSNKVKSVTGEPVDRTTDKAYQAFQSIVELGEFKGATYE